MAPKKVPYVPVSVAISGDGVTTNITHVNVPPGAVNGPVNDLYLRGDD
jgi:hypothetical protein